MLISVPLSPIYHDLRPVPLAHARISKASDLTKKKCILSTFQKAKIWSMTVFISSYGILLIFHRPNTKERVAMKVTSCVLVLIMVAKFRFARLEGTAEMHQFVPGQRMHCLHKQNTKDSRKTSSLDVSCNLQHFSGIFALLQSPYLPCST